MTMLTGWSDLSMDWTNPKSQEAKYMEALRQALMEKAESIPLWGTSPNYYSAVANYSKFLNLSKSSNNIFDNSFCTNFDYVLLTLLTCYSNGWLTDSWGTTQTLTNVLDTMAFGLYYNGSGSYTKYSNRGVSRMLALLGVTELIPPPHRYCLQADLWLKQRYTILNNLTQLCAFTAPPSSSNYAFLGLEVRYGFAEYSGAYTTATAAWNAAVSDYTTRGWEAYDPLNPLHTSAMECVSEISFDTGSERYLASLYSHRAKFYVNPGGNPGFDYFGKKVYDLYPSPTPGSLFVQSSSEGNLFPNWELEPTAYNFTQYDQIKLASTFSFSGALSEVPPGGVFPGFRIPITVDLGTPHRPSQDPGWGAPYQTYKRYTYVRGEVILNPPFRFHA